MRLETVEGSMRLSRDKIQDCVSYSFLLSAIKAYHPTDAMTNPSLILQAAKMDQYKHLVDEAVHYAKKNCKSKFDSSSSCKIT